jgi:hypothetical protein
MPLSFESSRPIRLAPWKQALLRVGRFISHAPFWRFVLRERTRYVLSWLILFVGAAIGLQQAWTAFDRPERRDGNDGHATIDFGGQYLMGRMLRQSYGRHLYHRDFQRAVLIELYPRSNEAPDAEKSDVQSLMDTFMGPHAPAHDRLSAYLATLASATPVEAAVLARANPPQVGGPLYPPINAFLFAPLTYLPPQPAYHMGQVINVIFALIAGIGLSCLSTHRVWVPVAVGFVMIYPGFSGSIALGQNATMTLAILVWGYVFMTQGSAHGGGAIWGLLAFKPVWALSFLLALLLMRRWSSAAAMAATSAILCLFTIPVVGLDAWWDWLAVGREATATYKYDANWIPLSRDLLGIPRRWLDFAPDQWESRRDNVPAELIGWGLLAAVFAVALAAAIARRNDKEEPVGPGPAFVLLSAWLCCFHFMYYDLLLTALPVFLLLVEPRRFLEREYLAWTVLRRGQLAPAFDGYHAIRAPDRLVPQATVRGTGFSLWVVNSLTLSLVSVLMFTAHGLPLLGYGVQGFAFDTACIVVIWLWCGWKWMRWPTLGDASLDAAQFVQLRADVAGAHERLADQDGPHARFVKA